MSSFETQKEEKEKEKDESDLCEAECTPSQPVKRVELARLVKIQNLRLTAFKMDRSCSAKLLPSLILLISNVRLHCAFGVSTFNGLSR